MLTAKLLGQILKASDLVDGHIRKIFDESATAVWFRFSGRVLYINLERSLPFWTMAQEKLTHPDAPSHFVETLRKYLQGGKVLSVEQPPGERMVTMAVEKYFPEESRVVPTRMVAELIPGKTNLFLIDEDGVILTAFREKKYKKRDLTVGSLYIPPAPRLSTEEKVEPAGEVDLEEVWREFRDEQEKQFIATRKDEVLRSLNKSRKKILKQLEKIERDQKGADRADEFKKRGELLKAHLGQIKKGMEKIEVVDYYAEGCPNIEIPLDPLVPPVANVEKLFKKYKKLTRAQDILEERREKTAQRLAEVDKKIDDLEDPDNLRKTLKKMGKLKRKMPKKHQKREKKDKSAEEFRRFQSSDDWTILVGRRARENDKLTFQVAKGNDFFFHVKNYGGSHVIVFNRERKDHLPQETMLDAATLAIYYSKMRGQTRAEVSYTQKKFVRKPKKSPPGRVLLSQEKNIMIDVEEDRLQRLLESSGEKSK